MVKTAGIGESTFFISQLPRVESLFSDDGLFEPDQPITFTSQK